MLCKTPSSSARMRQGDPCNLQRAGPTSCVHQYETFIATHRAIFCRIYDAQQVAAGLDISREGVAYRLTRKGQLVSPAQRSPMRLNLRRTSHRWHKESMPATFSVCAIFPFSPSRAAGQPQRGQGRCMLQLGPFAEWGLFWPAIERIDVHLILPNQCWRGNCKKEGSWRLHPFIKWRRHNGTARYQPCHAHRCG